MIDMEFFGSQYTRQKRCRNSQVVSRRLDRGVCDTRWRLQFLEATIEHLVRRQSDHNPLILRCSHPSPSPTSRPFRFQAAWCTHVDYPPLVKKAWDRDRGNVAKSLHNVSEDSKKFNKEVFGNIFARKRELEARLKGIQRALRILTQLV
jgi:hypothetical protein